jgi:hypothetical protein
MKKYLLLIGLMVPMLAFADTSKGETLTNMLWKDIQARSVKKIAHYTSKQFQAENTSTIFTRTEFLQSLEGLGPIDHYQLLNIQTTQGENVITVTYLVLLFSPPVNDITLQTSRQIIDVWKKQDDQWKWVSEAYLTLYT